MSGVPTEALPRGRASVGRVGIRVGAVFVLGLAAAFVTWLVVVREDEAATPAAPATQASVAETGHVAVTTALQPTLVSPPELRGVAATSAIPVYWAGARAGARIEVSSRTDGTFFVRYLPRGWRAGDPRPVITIATYPRPDGFAEVQRAARPGASTLQLLGGGLAVYKGERSTNVHLAYPGQAYQVEVFSPEVGVARKLVETGAVRPLR
jgi:hypothetical protein